MPDPLKLSGQDARRRDSSLSCVLSRLAGLGRWLGCGVGDRQPPEYAGGVEIEVGVAAKSPLVEPVLGRRAQHAQAVTDALGQADR